jgi:AroM protein
MTVPPDTSPRSGGRAHAGQTFYGAPVGILLLDCVAPFIAGSVGNASTWSIPVRYKTVPGLTVERILSPEADASQQAVVDAAAELVDEGAQLITSNCGFTIRYQQAVAAAVDAPVLLSSLLLAPFLERMLPREQSLGIITASAASLTPELLYAAGVGGSERVAIAGLDEAPAFTAGLIDCVGEMSAPEVEVETVEAAVELRRERPDVGILLLECSELPPYAAAVQRATGLPVYDFTSMVEFAAAGLRRVPFSARY